MLIKHVKKLGTVDRLAYWINERESIRLAKEAGEEAPWTHDSILQSYRFCNIRRMDDKVSKWLFDNWYFPYFDHPNMLLAVGLARFINKPETLEGITELVFEGKLPKWGKIKSRLRGMKQQGAIFNAAYMVRGNDGIDKIECVVDHYVKPLSTHLKDVVANTDSMELTHAWIQEFYGFGSFMAGQIVADLRWAINGRWLDRNTWAPMGPGSKKGMNELYGFSANCSLNQEDFLGQLQDTVESLTKLLPKSITSRMEMMDYQNCLCEFFKYSKTLNGWGTPKQRYPGAG